MKETLNTKLIDEKFLSKNILFNFIGKIFPLLAALIGIPIIIENIGNERFGILSIVWLLIGYFGVLDFGFSKSIVYELGKDIRSGSSNISEIAGTLTSFLLLIGFFMGAGIFFSSQFLIDNVFSIDDTFRDEVYLSFLILSIGTPITMVSTAFRGILETFQDFKRISYTDALFGGGTYLSLALVTYFSSSLVMLVSLMLILKLCIGIVFYAMSKDFIKQKIFTLSIEVEKIKQAFNFGKWIALSNFINPIMGQLDRYFIGAILSLSAVTLYTAPFDMVQKINLIPASITVVMFPAFTITSNSIKKSGSMFSNSILSTIIIVFPVSLFLVFFAHEVLLVWLGLEFANESTFVLQILIIGAFINSIAKIPFTLIQSLGFPDITAKLHLTEFIIYTPALWFMVSGYGIIGAAFARSIRVFFDWLFLAISAKKRLPSKLYIVETLALTVILISISYVSIFSIHLLIKFFILLLLLTIYIYIVWSFYLDDNLKSLVRRKIFFRKS